MITQDLTSLMPILSVPIFGPLLGMLSMMLVELFGLDPATAQIISIVILFVLSVIAFVIGSLWTIRLIKARSAKRKSEVSTLFNLIRNRKDKACDLHQVCITYFLGQLDWNEYPQTKIEEIMDRVDEQRNYIRKEFDSTLLSVLDERVQNDDKSAMVLLGQYYYDRPQNGRLYAQCR